MVILNQVLFFLMLHFVAILFLKRDVLKLVQQKSYFKELKIHYLMIFHLAINLNHYHLQVCSMVLLKDSEINNLSFVNRKKIMVKTSCVHSIDFIPHSMEYHLCSSFEAFHQAYLHEVFLTFSESVRQYQKYVNLKFKVPYQEDPLWAQVFKYQNLFQILTIRYK